MNQAKIILHDGNFPHFRTFDAMAAGIPVAAALQPIHFKDDWTTLGFEKNTDYISIDIYRSQNDLHYYLSGRDQLEMMAGNARKKVLNHHTWKHRAQAVLGDLHELRKVAYANY